MIRATTAATALVLSLLPASPAAAACAPGQICSGSARPPVTYRSRAEPEPLAIDEKAAMTNATRGGRDVDGRPATRHAGQGVTGGSLTIRRNR